MSSKKGALEINEIILFLIALVVLFALIYIFRSQISHFLTTLTGIQTSIEHKTPPLEQIIGS